MSEYKQETPMPLKSFITLQFELDTNAPVFLLWFNYNNRIVASRNDRDVNYNRTLYKSPDRGLLGGFRRI
jgi:hypothetical protein